MLAFLGNLAPLEIVVILVVAVLIFGKDLPQAASKAYMQVRKLRGAVDDLRRDSGIERELRDIERTVREAEWEARRTEAKGALPRTIPSPAAASWRPPSSPPPEVTGPESSSAAAQPSPEPGPVNLDSAPAGEAPAEPSEGSEKPASPAS